MLIREAELDGRARVDVWIEGARIRAVGHRLPVPKSVKVHEARGGALLPGLHDHHTHLFALAAAEASIPCGPPETRDRSELEAALREAGRSGSGWLRGVGYHESVAGSLDRARLDAWVSDRPLRIQHRSGSMWMLNSRALDELLDATPPPAGLERDPLGRPTGRLFRGDAWLHERLRSAPPRLEPLGLRLAALGITGVTDATADTDRERFETLAELVAAGALPQTLRVMGNDSVTGPDRPRATVGARKFLLDEPRLPDLADFCAAAGRAHAAGRNVAVHCVTRAELVFCLAGLREVGIEAGDRVEHAAVAPPELVDAVADAGLVVVTQPHFVSERGDQYRAEVEAPDLPWLYRLRAWHHAASPWPRAVMPPSVTPIRGDRCGPRSLGGLRKGSDSAPPNGSAPRPPSHSSRRPSRIRGEARAGSRSARRPTSACSIALGPRRASVSRAGTWPPPGARGVASSSVGRRQRAEGCASGPSPRRASFGEPHHIAGDPGGRYPGGMHIRPRRNRARPALRRLLRETELGPNDLVLPLFVQDGDGVTTPIASMPGHARLSIDLLIEKAREASELGIPGVALFPALPEAEKDPRGTACTKPDGLLQRCVRELKSALPELLVITDVALDPYSSDGHDGVVIGDRIDNDETLPILAEMAVAQAAAGADVVAPSDMMDGRVGAIRSALDEAGFTEVAIGSYCTKYASAFYGPFRDALDSAPKAGDKKTYQMDPANAREALREIALDEAEGADWLMVKPGLVYADIIRLVSDNTALPVAAYHVSGEYAMLKAAAERGWLDYDACLLESLLSLKRAGADVIFTYGAIEAAQRLAADR